MKKRFLATMLGFVLMFGNVSLSAQAAETGSAETQAVEVLEQIKGQLSDAFDNMDSETAGEIFSFVKEKLEGGVLDSEESIQKAIEEGEEKFGVEVNPEAARQVVDTMEKLEELGFSSEVIVDKAGELYQQYGADFVEHADEVIKEAVKGAVKKAAGSFWNSIKSAVSDFFKNLF